MCGIAGYFDVDGTRLPRSVVEKMNYYIAHRGPDDSGIYLGGDDGSYKAAESSWGLGHQRLAILDLSEAGHQPMCSRDGRYVIVFNGEIYNHQAIRLALLEQRPELTFRSSSDTETILEAFAVWGEQAVSHFIGMFALAIFDQLTEELSLYRDRLGIKPLYYFWDEQHFAFASELKAFRGFPYYERQIDRNALALYLLYGYVPSPVAIFENCYKLEPGASLVVSRHGIRKQTYWAILDLLEKRQVIDDASDDELVEQLDQLLRDSVQLRLLSDVPLGALLSGGIDSTTVVAIMQSLSDRPIKTFSIGFRETGYDETVLAKRIASFLGTEHYEHYVTANDVLHLVGEAVKYSDEPFADSSLLPTMLVSGFARQHVTVALSGDGGDELFWGYNQYVRYARLKSYLPIFRLLTHDSIRSILSSIPHPKVELVASLPPISSPFDLYNALQTPFRLSSVIRLFNISELTQNGITWEKYNKSASDYFDSHPAELENTGFYDLQTRLVDRFLTKVDRASMRVALETRVPLLDHRIVEFSLRLPFAMKYRNGITKYILKKVLRRYIPDKLTNAPKHGFSAPMSSWMGHELRPAVKKYLSVESLGSQGIFNAQSVQPLLKQHFSGRYNHSQRLWTLLVFQMWFAKHC